MASANRDPHTIETTLVGVEEYQAPPREEPHVDQEATPGQEDPTADPQIDINLLESQQQKPGPQISETIDVAPREKTDFTVSGPDEETQPGGPRAVPPGESM